MTLSSGWQHVESGYIRLRNSPFWRDHQAVTSIEYALIALIMVMAIILGARTIGHSLSLTFNSVSSEL